MAPLLFLLLLLVLSSSEGDLPNHEFGQFGKIYAHYRMDNDTETVIKSCSTLATCEEEGMLTGRMQLQLAYVRKYNEAKTHNFIDLDQRLDYALNKTPWMFSSSMWGEHTSELKVEVPMKWVGQYYVEQVSFQALPGWTVSCAFFIPSAINQGFRLPGLLFAAGHYELGYRYPMELKVILRYVARGMIVLACDAPLQGERLGREPLDIPTNWTSCKEQQKISQLHDVFGQRLFSLDETLPPKLWVLEALHALRHLEENPLVDKRRIGMLGCSGGGMLTAYLGAVAGSRILATSISCYISNEEDEMMSGTGCNVDAEQVMRNFTKVDLLAVRAQRNLATLVVLSSHDCFPFQSARRLLDQIWGAYPYAPLSVQECVGLHDWHEDGLLATDAFFKQILGTQQDGPVYDAPPCSLLRSFPDGFPADALSSDELLIAMESFATRGTDEQIIEKALRVVLPAIFPDGRTDAPKIFFPMAETADSKFSMMLIYSIESCPIKVRGKEPVISFQQPTHVSPVILVLAYYEFVNDELEEWHRKLAKHDFFTFYFVSLCGVGDKHWSVGWSVYGPQFIGTSHVALHVKGIITVAEMFNAWGIIASGQLASAAVHAAFHYPFKFLGLKDPLFYRGSKVYPWEMLLPSIMAPPAYDIPDLLTILINRKNMSITVFVEQFFERQVYMDVML